MMGNFIQEHRGYLWKEVIASHVESPGWLDFTVRTGGLLRDPLAGRYTSILRNDPGEIVSKPHIVGTTRELEHNPHGNWEGSWVGALFDHHPPKLGFRRGEQRLLSSALSGVTDEHLAETVETSLPAVKKMWVSIYCRVEDYMPELICDPLQADMPASGRGKEKCRLLAYPRTSRGIAPRLAKASFEVRTGIRANGAAHQAAWANAVEYRLV